MVVPLEEPPVGTRGRPFRDRFFSGAVGRSQLPALAAVLEKGRRATEAVPGFDVLQPEEGMRRVLTGRMGAENSESLSR